MMAKLDGWHHNRRGWTCPLCQADKELPWALASLVFLAIGLLLGALCIGLALFDALPAWLTEPR
ncbi:hypothetical protein [Glycomyces paridis]|uniref:Uncharacterized protein n=1 Tax=Glycomyces paridis TaxID=2126555 RepID=A0A4S8PQ29_9ACTN|nr:hypothetical protein [Glycomyces paridis]THV30679.1 hypothetical protein E9998_04640 [Glycomyces paridis]